jgi:hypothetical protein
MGGDTRSEVVDRLGRVDPAIVHGFGSCAEEMVSTRVHQYGKGGGNKLILWFPFQVTVCDSLNALGLQEFPGRNPNDVSSDPYRGMGVDEYSCCMYLSEDMAGRLRAVAPEIFEKGSI